MIVIVVRNVIATTQDPNARKDFSSLLCQRQRIIIIIIIIIIMIIIIIEFQDYCRLYSHVHHPSQFTQVTCQHSLPVSTLVSMVQRRTLLWIDRHLASMFNIYCVVQTMHRRELEVMNFQTLVLLNVIVKQFFFAI